MIEFMTPTLPDVPAVELQIIELTNAFRSQNKLEQVKPNTALTAVARAYAAYLAKSGQFSHTADGREASDRVSAGGYEWCETAENLAAFLDPRGFTTIDLAKSSVEGWINSPGHRKNMLTQHVTETGVGVVRAPGDKPKFISVQLFARPKALSYEFQISNSAGLPVTYTFGDDKETLQPHYATRLTACFPGALTFETAVKGKPAQAISGRYEATGGVTYVLKPDTALGVKVEIEKLEKVK